MNFARILCWFGYHRLTTWRTSKTTYLPVGPATFAPMSRRHCKRAGCKFSETRPLLTRKPYQRKRDPNAADTIQKETP